MFSLGQWIPINVLSEYTLKKEKGPFISGPYCSGVSGCYWSQEQIQANVFCGFRV